MIGTGPAGSTIARELSGTGLRFTVVECGGFTRQRHTDELNEVENVGRLREPDQLYVAGSSTFPTAGHCNPTHMIVAPASRLADTLKQRLSAGDGAELRRDGRSARV